ncbi:MAG: response regulator [Fibrobacter sp.]|nr:response regulator [Fibrobacter sp.]
MKTLVAEDDLTSGLILEECFKHYGPVVLVKDGKEAVDEVQKAVEEKDTYNLICLDIMMPNMSGRSALVKIREIEEKAGIRGLDRSKIVMITALDDNRNIIDSFKDECDGYIIKPFNKKDLINKLETLELI